MSLIAALVGVILGGFITIEAQRRHATWLKRRDAAAEAYAAAVAVNSAMLSSLRLARQVSAAIRSSGDIQDVVRSADWPLSNTLAVSKTRIEKLRDARLSLRSIWGVDVADLFDEYFDLAAAWHNALGDWVDGINGAGDPSANEFEADGTGFNWQNIIDGNDPDTAIIDHALEALNALILRFAREAGVIVDEGSLPEGVQHVIADHRSLTERRRLALEAKQTKALPSGK